MSAMFDYVAVLDEKLLSVVNRRPNSIIFDRIMKLSTQLGSLPVAIAIPLLLLLSHNSRFEAAGRGMTMILIFSQIIVHTLKWAVNRPRPFTVPDPFIYCRSSAPGFSFPSGHSCSAFAVAISAGHFLSISIIPLLSLAALVGISRIYLGVHYPSDVLAGSFVAIAVFLVYII